MLGLRWPKLAQDGQLEWQQWPKDGRYGACRWHLSARGGPPGTIKEGFDKLKLIDLDTRFTHARPAASRGRRIIQCATREKPPPCLKTVNWSYELKACVFKAVELGNFVLEWRREIVEICSKILSKMVPNPWKSSSGAVLEHFGDPLGAKMAQDRHQEQKKYEK